MKKLFVILAFLACAAFECAGQNSTKVYSGQFSIDDSVLMQIIFGDSSGTISGDGVFGYYEDNGQEIKHGKLVFSFDYGKSKILGEYSNGNKTGQWIVTISDISYELNFLQDKIAGPIRIEYSGNTLSGNMKDNHWVGEVNITEVIDGTSVQHCLNFNSNGIADQIWKVSRTDGSYLKYEFANGVLLSLIEYSANTGNPEVIYTLSDKLKELLRSNDVSSVFSDSEGIKYQLEESSDYSISGYNIGCPCESAIFNRMLSLGSNGFKKLVNLTHLQEVEIARKEALRKQQEEQDETNGQTPGSALDGQNGAHNAADTALDIGAAHIHSQLGADEALNDQGQGQSHRQHGLQQGGDGDQSHADESGPAEGTGAAVDGLHGLGTLFIPLRHSGGDSRPQGAAGLGVGAADKMNLHLMMLNPF